MNHANRPADFDAYWADLDQELAATPMAAEMTHLPLHSTEFADMYGLRLTSVGPYRIFAYFSIPKGEGPFPARFDVPGYGSVVHLGSYEDRQNYVSLSLRHRGQRLADQPYAAAYPGLLTDGIGDPATYIYRGIVADCCRAVDFLAQHPAVDKTRMAAVGNDLAALTAALRPQITRLVCTPGLFYRAQELTPAFAAYPQEEYNDFARTYPEQADAMWQTVGYFDPLYSAAQIKAPTLLVAGDSGDPLAQALGGPVERYASARSAFKDGVQVINWLAQGFGIADPALPNHWREV